MAIVPKKSHFQHHQEVLTLFKEKVAQRFSKAAPEYDDAAHVQRQCAQYLSEKISTSLPVFSPQRILDLGTGTGYMINFLKPFFPNAYYTLNDCALGMLEHCKKKFPDLNGTYILGDLEDLTFSHQDLIVSNFVFQWLPEIPETLRRLYWSTSVLGFSCLLEGTFSQWYTLLEQEGIAFIRPQYPKFSHINSICKTLSRGKFSSWSASFELNFSNIREFMRYLQQLGASAIAAFPSYSHLRSLLSMPESSFKVQYHVFFAILTHK